jgi:hypothetical protein
MTAARARFATETPERDPEMVVVFDLAGTVDQFTRAVRLIPGLEFLAELAEEDADPDEDFHYIDKQGGVSNRSVPETLYMVMSNARAVDELISLFNRWQADERARFPNGLAPFKDVFRLLRSVRRWGPQDRIRETGLLESWEEEKEVVGQSATTRQVEIELWFRADEVQRSMAQAEVERVVADSGGSVVASATLPDIAYHGVLADIPFTEIETVLQHGPDSIALLRTDSIMFVSPARPMTIPAVEIADSTTVGTVPPPAVAAPRVALLDGLPLANHEQLAGRLVIDDPDDHTSRYHSVAQRQHGTAMASLICHGDLNSRGRPLSTRLYVRPILEPHPTNPRVETTARGQLLVDLVHRAFRRMFEGDGQHPPAAPSVRIVNLSIGDPLRTFARHLSPLARLLDWLASKYNLVIVVSAGNHSVVSTVPTQVVRDGTRLPESVAADVYSKARLRRLMSPAEAVNVVTVGALHADHATGWASDTVIDGGKEAMPAPYSAVGFGYRRSVKPEILLPGGRQLFERPLPTPDKEVTLYPARHLARGPGMRVAAPGVGGDIRATAFLSGTSNAAALATRLANEIMDALETYQAGDGEFRFPDAQYHPVLAKTLLVHAASWGDMEPWLAEVLDLPRRTARRDITQILGYGAVDPDRVAAASRTRAVLIGAATIRDREQHTFAFPLPPSLRATTDWRRLTITMGWLSPISARSLRHRIARLRFKPPQKELGVKRVQADPNAAVNGTVQHEILEGASAVAYAVGDTLSITVDARIDDVTPSTKVRYGIAASIEIAANAQADIHDEVRQALRVLARQQQRVRADVATHA